jgi:hypothetical protein
VARIALNDDAANNDVKSAKDEVDEVWNLRFSYSHRSAALTDFEHEATNGLCLSHPFCREQQSAEERDASAIPFTGEVIGLDATKIGLSYVGLHSLTSMLACPPLRR